MYLCLQHKEEMSPESLMRRAHFLKQYLQRLHCRQSNKFPGHFLVVFLTASWLGLTWVQFHKSSFWMTWSLLLQSWEGHCGIEWQVGQLELRSHSAIMDSSYVFSGGWKESYDFSLWDFLQLGFPLNQCFTNIFWACECSRMLVSHVDFPTSCLPIWI